MKSQGNSVASDDKFNFDSFAFFATIDRKYNYKSPILELYSRFWSL